MENIKTQRIKWVIFKVLILCKFLSCSNNINKNNIDEDCDLYKAYVECYTNQFKSFYKCIDNLRSPVVDRVYPHIFKAEYIYDTLMDLPNEPYQPYYRAPAIYRVCYSKYPQNKKYFNTCIKNSHKNSLIWPGIDSSKS